MHYFEFDIINIETHEKVKWKKGELLPSLNSNTTFWTHRMLDQASKLGC